MTKKEALGFHFSEGISSVLQKMEEMNQNLRIKEAIKVCKAFVKIYS